MTIALGYARVSTERQGESGLGLESQAKVINDAAAGRGWAVQQLYVDVASGKSTNRRPQLNNALKQLAAGEAQVLVVAKLDRLSRSLVDFATLMGTARKQGWAVVALDIGVDTSTINGELVANIIMALAEWERRIIGERIKAALGIAKDRGTHVGRAQNVTDQTKDMIAMMRLDRKSYREIAEALEAAKVPTPQGGAQWHASSVRTIHVKDVAAA